MYYILKTTEPILLQIGITGPQGNETKSSTFRVTKSKINVTSTAV